MAVLAQTCKIALPARVAARSGKTARRSTAVVAKAAAPVDAVRVQQKVRTAFSQQARYPYIHLADRGPRSGFPSADAPAIAPAASARRARVFIDAVAVGLGVGSARERSHAVETGAAWDSVFQLAGRGLFSHAPYRIADLARSRGPTRRRRRARVAIDSEFELDAIPAPHPAARGGARVARERARRGPRAHPTAIGPRQRGGEARDVFFS